MEFPAMRNLKLALSVSSGGDPTTSSAHNRRNGMGSGASSSSSSSSRGSSTATSPVLSRQAASSAEESGDDSSYESQEEEEEEEGEELLSSSRGSGSSSGRKQSADESHLNLPLDREFVPLTHHDDEEEEEEEEEEAEVVRDEVRDDVICMIFDLPRPTKFYLDFSCAIAATLAMHGRMYPTDTHVCFYSNVFGRERKILIPYESISEIAKTTTMVFQNAIRIATTSKEEYTFTSFWGNNRDSCYELIAKTRNRVLNDLKPTVVRGLKKSVAGSSSASAEGENTGDHSSSSSSSSSPVTSPTSNASAAKADGDTTASTVHEETDDADSDAEAQQRIRTAEASAVRQSTIAEEHHDDSQQQQDAGDGGADLELRTLARSKSVVSDIGSVAPKDISMTQIIDETFDISVEDFMAEFFWDDAGFGMDEFGNRQGSTEMKCNPWMTPLEDDSTFGMTRSLQFRVPVDAPIGPKSSRVDVLQCAKTGEHNIRIIETSTRLVDIPYGDYFSVEDRWTLIPSSSTSCKLFIELKVVFSKSTFWKSKIETRAIADNKTKWLEWVDMAKQHLADKNKQAEPQAAAPTVAPATPQKHHHHTLHQDPLVHRHSQATPRTAPKRRTSRTTTSQRSKSGLPPGGPSNSLIMYLRVFPWILVLGLLFLVVRMQSSLANIEQTLTITNARMSAIETQLASLSTASCSADR